MSKVIVTAAITGSIHTPTMSEYLPITADEIAEDAVRAYQAGAAVVHIHARDPKTGMPTADLGIFEEIISKIKARCNVIICITTGGGMGQTVEQRGAAVKKFSPELASLNAGSINFSLFHAIDAFKEFRHPWEKQYLAMSEDYIFPNTFKTLREFSTFFREENTRPEFEIYDAGMLNNLTFLIQKGYVEKPVYLQFVLGILGGMQPTLNNLLFLYNSAKELIGDFNWSVCAAGRHQMSMCTAALLMRGNVRVGLEDNLYLEKGIKARSSADQVAKIIRIAKELGIDPATPDEARQILRLKGTDKS
jgi:uncharacterized protein (DUF849 family)